MTAKLGEKELGRWRIEDRAEMEKEATIEEKIRIRKKEKAKRRAEASRRMEQCQPRRKKMKLTEKEGDNIEKAKRKESGSQHLKEGRKKTTPKKRKVMREEGQQQKRPRPNSNIRKYITCKRWKEMEGQQVSDLVNGEKTGHYIDREGLGDGEKTGHYLGREGEMQDREESPVKEEQTGH